MVSPVTTVVPGGITTTRQWFFHFNNAWIILLIFHVEHKHDNNTNECQVHEYTRNGKPKVYGVHLSAASDWDNPKKLYGIHSANSPALSPNLKVRPRILRTGESLSVIEISREMSFSV
jgi:hypothetical protein